MNHVDIEVNKHIELIQVLIYLSERQEKTFQHLNNVDYFAIIKSYFQRFKKHEAVKLTTDLIDKNNFIHIKPLRAILSINEIANNIEHPLYKWSVAVKDFVKVSNFDNFFKNNHDYYCMFENRYKSYGIEKWLECTELFFKKEFNRYSLILCPCTGNYGFILDIPEKETAYQVEAVPFYDEKGEECWDIASFAYGTAHEFGHCFVNPVVEGHKDKLNDLRMFFQSHKNMLYAYNVDYAVMNEYFVRAYSVKFMKKFKNDFMNFDINAVIERHRKIFIHIDEFIKYLDEYESGDLSFEAFYLSKLDKISILC